MKNVLFLLASAICFHQGFAQSDSNDKNSVLHIDAGYQSNSVYQGRKDSLKIPYSLTGLRYNAASGFYAGASAYLLTTETRLDAISLETGYEFSKGNFYGGLGAFAYIYDPQSVNVLAGTSTSLSGYAGFSLPWIEPGVSAGISLGDRTPDYMAGLSLQHAFATENESFSFTPGAYLNAGTQNYYSAYYSTRRYSTSTGKGRGSGKKTTSGSGSSTVLSAQTLQSSSFKVLDYEFAAEFKYNTKQFTFLFVPKYAIPQSPSKVVISTKGGNGSITKTTEMENISNSFYWNAGVSYAINFRKASGRKR